MGKVAKGSRKGKKAWRANIKSDDIEEFFEKATKDAHSGASSAITSLPSESLFYVDKSTDIPVKRKIEKHRHRVLHYESLLQRNPFVQPVLSSTLKKRKKQTEIKTVKAIRDTSKKEDSGSQLDIWNSKDEENVKCKKVWRKSTNFIPAVEIEPPGCSFNPPFEAHQDSLAEAVADEMQKVYQNELGPQPVPLLISGETIEEEDKYFLDADDGNEGKDEENANDDLVTQRKSKPKKVTRVEFNRRARLKARMKAEEEEKKKEDLSKQIDCLSDIIEEIAKEDEEKDIRHRRRVIAKHDVLKVRPPRFGKYKFEPAPKQVLLTEDISGSIRMLKGCCTLARDRYKSLEKRGLLPPRGNGTGQSQRRRGSSIWLL